MNDIRQYWKAVRAIEATLPADVWLVGVESQDFLTQVPAEAAAKMLHAKSHRMATEEEIESHRAREAAENRSARRERLRRSGAAVVAVDDGEGGEAPKATVKQSPESPRRRLR
jgi:hypothetical protein